MLGVRPMRLRLVPVTFDGGEVVLEKCGRAPMMTYNLVGLWIHWMPVLYGFMRFAAH